MKITLPRLIVFCTAVTVLISVFVQRQQLLDWWKLRGYTPPPAVTQLAEEDTMNAYTRHLFYLNRPQLLNTVADFRAYCPENARTIVLGCYHPGQNGIYIYAVQDQSLAGIQQVTAAHEVLHAIYARLSDSARTQLDNELESYYKHGLTNPTVKAEVLLYKKTEPHAVFDEMSCTFGTEIAQLPAALSSYYMQFFTDRQKIVAYEQQYQAQFTDRERQITAYDTQLSSLKQQINAQENNLTAQNGNLSAEQSVLQSLLSGDQTQRYNAIVPTYNAQVDAYNTGLGALKQNITIYNDLVRTRNTVAGQLTTLDSAIDTRLSTVPTTAK